jgi:hypothetical protein
MAARAHVAVDVTGLVIVHVDHTVFDSFSRSVMPTSARAWKRAINRGAATTHRVADLAPDWTVDGTDCMSFVAFGPTFESARAALEAHVDSMNPDTEDHGPSPA